MEHNKKAIFIDFDGTLGEHGIIPKAHVDALAQVRKNGHLVFLCTGRPRSIVFDEVVELLDGVIASAGCYVEINSKIIQDIRYDQDLTLRALKVLDEIPNLHYVLESAENMYGNAESYKYLKGLLESFSLGGVDIEEGGVGSENIKLIDAFKVVENLSEQSFSKIVFWSSPESVEKIGMKIGPKIRPMPNSINNDGETSGELQLAGVDKIDGVKKVISELNIPIENTISCGDGHNDVQMLNQTHYAVVIEGSSAQKNTTNKNLLAVPGPNQVGLVKAFKQLELMN